MNRMKMKKAEDKAMTESSKITVGDLIGGNVRTIKAGEDLLRLYNLMEDIHVRHVPVVNDDGEIEGIVSDRDLIKAALFSDGELPLSQQRDFMQSMTVDEIMTKDPECVDIDEDVRAAGRILLDNRFSCLPVTDNGKLVGIITGSDFVKYVCNHAVK